MVSEYSCAGTLSQRRQVWGVQYHPKIDLDETASAFRGQADDLVAAGLARTLDEVEGQADLVEALHRDPGRRDLAWRLGLDGEVTDNVRRQRELRNFITELVAPPAWKGRGEWPLRSDVEAAEALPKECPRPPHVAASRVA